MAKPAPLTAPTTSSTPPTPSSARPSPALPAASHRPCRPALGAAFTQYTAELEPGGVLTQSDLPNLQRFVYVVSGAVDLSSEATFRTLPQSAFAYIPPDHDHALTATEPTVLQIIEKPYLALPSHPTPPLQTGLESESPQPPSTATQTSLSAPSCPPALPPTSPSTP